MLGNGEMSGKANGCHQRADSKTHLATSKLVGSELDYVALVWAHWRQVAYLNAVKSSNFDHMQMLILGSWNWGPNYMTTQVIGIVAVMEVGVCLSYVARSGVVDVAFVAHADHQTSFEDGLNSLVYSRSYNNRSVTNY